MKLAIGIGWVVFTLAAFVLAAHVVDGFLQ